MTNLYAFLCYEWRLSKSQYCWDPMSLSQSLYGTRMNMFSIIFSLETWKISSIYVKGIQSIGRLYSIFERVLSESIFVCNVLLSAKYFIVWGKRYHHHYWWWNQPLKRIIFVSMPLAHLSIVKRCFFLQKYQTTETRTYCAFQCYWKEWTYHMIENHSRLMCCCCC